MENLEEAKKRDHRKIGKQLGLFTFSPKVGLGLPLWLPKGTRVLFGKDTYKKSEFDVYFRILETSDEYFDYYRKRHAHWKMYGLNLPDSILKKLYYKNARKLFPNIPLELFEPN